MTKLAIGFRVKGKSKGTLHKVGVVLAVDNTKRQPWYSVQWDNGMLFEPNSDSLALVDPNLESQRSQTTSMLAGTFISNTLSESPSSEEEDSLEEGEDEEQSTELVSSMITGISDDGKILAHNRKCESCSDVFVDPTTLQRKRKTFFRWPSTLQLGDKSCSKYFYLMYPWSTIQTTLKHTNSKLVERKQRPIAEGDFFRYLGPRRGPLRTYWEKEILDGFADTAANFGERFRMTRHSFEIITGTLSFSDDVPSDDPWKLIRPLINGFNSRRLDVVSPGKEGKYCHDGMPHKTKIPRKPEGVGAKLKAVADGDAGVLLGFDLMEGAERQKMKLYKALFGKGTAIVPRVTEFYKGSGRTVVADSAFAYVKTLVQLENISGLYFMGMVKTASREYPKAYMKE
ncbi:hypothetical protein PHPALM_31954 [Phytophthora palmivora]|uniref:PiggyBac transposable element-derived protein domain-containing protein n=1 Tax=Phytophthora palmivora TaxID=4796 RepID=A0A2P4X1A7_9STRA|nr:hypothetical protein PHPALM_31954 [Phytophthora palmivora]